MAITFVFPPSSSPCPSNFHHPSSNQMPTPRLRSRTTFSSRHRHQAATSPPPPTSPKTTTTTIKPIKIEKSSLSVEEATSDTELRAAACLRVRTFYDFRNQSFGVQDHKKYLVEREFEALKERVSGKVTAFRRVSCINATLPVSQISNTLDDLCSSCHFSNDGEDRVVVGTLDINQCIRLPDEITGTKPMGIGADFARAYLSNVCVARELQRNGLGYVLITKAKAVAEEWGISDLYVHVAVDNEPAKNLYLKSGFIHESDEPAWQARFVDRPRRLLLWAGLPTTYDL